MTAICTALGIPRRTAYKDGHSVRLVSRYGNDNAVRFPGIV